MNIRITTFQKLAIEVEEPRSIYPPTVKSKLHTLQLETNQLPYVLPILIEETSFPVREKSSLNTSHVSDAYSFSVLPEEGNMSLNCTRLTFLSLLEVPFSSKNQMCLDAQLSFQNCIDLKVDREDAYSSCFLDINIEKETPDIFKSSDKTVGNLKGVVTHLQKVLQRQASLSVDKSSTERVYDAPTTRWRRYKRAASFDSRKMVLLFSIL
ncbi:hypothetical protein GOBAR_AA29072 [Gossypium barbadense]|uniref:Uncharacterized protein n=1 Tax=Gossypium barbadense TaxID=3634 RepID=A0A2P5WKJ4_GOSBA|nr:hypothetical protein GOBAR_AA29072 [Gossypium barbadense]